MSSSGILRILLCIAAAEVTHKLTTRVEAHSTIVETGIGEEVTLPCDLDDLDSLNTDDITWTLTDNTTLTSQSSNTVMTHEGAQLHIVEVNWGCQS